MRANFLCLSLVLGLLLAGCADREATVYDVPREDPQPPTESAATAPLATSPYGDGGTNAERPTPPRVQPVVQGESANPMAGRTLPASALNPVDGNPAWAVPPEWSAAAAGQMRRATFLTAGGAQVAITSFPGDVGGDLNNVNRWRRQTGLAPIGPDALEASFTRLTRPDGGEAKVVRLEGPSQSMLAAIVPQGAHTWFARLTADADEIDAESARFAAFVGSWDFGGAASASAPTSGY